MHDHQDEDVPSPGPSWQNLAMGCGLLLLSITGYIIGDTLSSLRQELRDVHQALTSHASLAARLDSVEKRTADQEERLRDIERQQWQRQGVH